jgi:hypothetical protein
MNQSDTWQDLTRAKSRVTSAEASAIGTLICQEHTATETPKSRYAILRCNHSRWIKNEIWTVDLRHREIEDRESQRHVHSDIENAETPMRGLTEVMC